MYTTWGINRIYVEYLFVVLLGGFSVRVDKFFIKQSISKIFVGLRPG